MVLQGPTEAIVIENCPFSIAILRVDAPFWRLNTTIMLDLLVKLEGVRMIQILAVSS